MPKKNTRNARGSGMIRQRPNGLWEARYTTGRNPGTGKQIQKTIYGKTQQEVRQKLTKALGELDEGTYFEPSKMTVAQWFDIWLSEHTGDKKYLTIRNYNMQYRTHIKPGFGAVKLSELTVPIIQKFYNDLLRGIGCTTPLSPKTVRNIHGTLTTALSVAVRIGYLKVNPTAFLTLPRMVKKEMKPLTDPQVTAFLAAAGEDVYGLLLKTILFTGLRESEAIGLTWDCVDFKAGTILINKQLQSRAVKDGGLVFAPLKNDRSRTLTPAPSVLKLLERRRHEETRQRLRAGDGWQGWQDEKERQSALIFTNELGGALHPQTVYVHFKKLVASIGAPNARVHDLRHTFAVLSLQNGDDVKTLQDNLGHATAAFTLDVYGHVSEKMKRDSADRMERYIMGATGV